MWNVSKYSRKEQKKSYQANGACFQLCPLYLKKKNTREQGPKSQSQTLSTTFYTVYHSLGTRAKLIKLL